LASRFMGGKAPPNVPPETVQRKNTCRWEWVYFDAGRQGKKELRVGKLVRGRRTVREESGKREDVKKRHVNPGKIGENERGASGHTPSKMV